MGSDGYCKIGDIAEVFDGPHATPKKITSGPYFLSISSLESGKLDLSKSAHISEEQFTKWTKRVTPQQGDVLFSYETRLGEAALMPSNVRACLGRRMGLLRPDTDKVLPEYLLYSYLAPEFQQEIKKRTVHGATVDRIALRELPDFNLRLPSLPEQRQTVSLLKVVDEKIQLNRQTNQTLEQMAQALFKSWFVDFDPVIDNALAAGNPIPDELQGRAQLRQQQLAKPDHKPLPENIRQLFPSEFELTEELGWVPKGWEATKLEKLITISHGYAFKGEFFSPLATDDILLTPGNFCVGGGFKAGKSKYYNGPVPEGYILSHNDLIVTMTDLSKAGDTLGYPAFVPDSKTSRYLHNQRLGKVSFTTSEAGKEFIYRCLTTNQYRDEVLASATGSTVKHSAPKKILAHVIAYSKGIVESKFEDLCSSYTEKISLNSRNSYELERLRDTLLPKLISGELRMLETLTDTQQPLNEALA